MSKTVIGCYTDEQHAQQVKRELESQGFSNASFIRGGGIEQFEKFDVPRDDARMLEQDLEKGSVLVAVQTDANRAELARQIMSAHQAQQTNAGNVQGSAKIPVVEEELQVGKREVSQGGVRVFTRVVEQPTQAQVQLREEHVTVNRTPVDRPATEADFSSFKEGTIELKETAEEAVVAKRARVVEEVTVGKEVSQRTETIQDTVRHTEVDVQPIEHFENDFRSHFDKGYKASGKSYDEYSPAYQYGYDLAQDPQFRNRDWSQIEQQAKNGWEIEHKGTWANVKDHVRHAWEAVSSKRATTTR
jgi:uncharacterized protein (TIGR02271 family)